MGSDDSNVISESGDSSLVLSNVDERESGQTALSSPVLPIILLAPAALIFTGAAADGAGFLGTVLILSAIAGLSLGTIWGLQILFRLTGVWDKIREINNRHRITEIIAVPFLEMIFLPLLPFFMIYSHISTPKSKIQRQLAILLTIDFASTVLGMFFLPIIPAILFGASLTALYNWIVLMKWKSSNPPPLGLLFAAGSLIGAAVLAGQGNTEAAGAMAMGLPIIGVSRDTFRRPKLNEPKSEPGFVDPHDEQDAYSNQDSGENAYQLISAFIQDREKNNRLANRYRNQRLMIANYDRTAIQFEELRIDTQIGLIEADVEVELNDLYTETEKPNTSITGLYTDYESANLGEEATLNIIDATDRNAVYAAITILAENKEARFAVAGTEDQLLDTAKGINDETTKELVLAANSPLLERFDFSGEEINPESGTIDIHLRQFLHQNSYSKIRIYSNHDLTVGEAFLASLRLDTLPAVERIAVKGIGAMIDGQFELLAVIYSQA